MRKLKITKLKQLLDAADGTGIVCPQRHDEIICETKCAWFRTEHLGTFPATYYCQDIVIGELEEC